MNKLKVCKIHLLDIRPFFNFNTKLEENMDKEEKMSHCVNLNAVDDILDIYKNT